MSEQIESHKITFFVSEKFIRPIILDLWDELNDSEQIWLSQFLMTLSEINQYDRSYWVISTNPPINSECVVSLEITKVWMVTLVCEKGEPK